MKISDKKLVPDYLIRLQWLLSAILFFLIILGAAVRVAHAGLSCPDWPLCFGQLVPVFNFEIFMEWIHRVIAMSVGFLALFNSVIIFKSAVFRKQIGILVIISLLLFALQAYLGRQTVLELLNAGIVNSHLMGGYSLMAVNFWIAFRLRELRMGRFDNELYSYRWIFLLFAAFTFLQATVGGTVSSHYAGLACPDFPKCNGSWWPGLSGIVGIRYLHQLGAFFLLFLTFGISFFIRKNSQAKWVFFLAGVVIAGQISVGVSMVFTQLHPALSILHSALAITLFTIFWVSTLRAFLAKMSLRKR